MCERKFGFMKSDAPKSLNFVFSFYINVLELCAWKKNDGRYIQKTKFMVKSCHLIIFYFNCMFLLSFVFCFIESPPLFSLPSKHD